MSHSATMSAIRQATWECRACPDDEQWLLPGPHYVDKEQAREGLRVHFLTEHAADLWNPATRDRVAGDVLVFTEA